MQQIRASAAPRGRARRALAASTRTAFASQRIYFVMPDRYANADPANDRGGLSGSGWSTGFDPADTGWFHGGDLKGLTGGCTDPRHGLQRIKDLGFSALWVTPVLKQQAVQGGSAAYHGYWGLDFTTVDPHLGTRRRLRGVRRVRAPAGAEGLPRRRRQPHGRRDRARRLGSTRTCRTATAAAASSARPVRGGEAFPVPQGGEHAADPARAPGDRTAKRPAWLNDALRYHNRGDIDFASCTERCYEQGDFFGLDDLFTEQPAVANGLAKVYGDWIRRFKVDGFRVDTAQHVDRAFFRLWAPRILAAARAAGVRDFQIFGEVFVTDGVDLSALRPRARPAERARLPVPGRARPLRLRRVGRRGPRTGSPTTTTSAARPAARTRRRRSSATTTWAVLRFSSQDASQATGGRSARARACSRTACSTSCAARRSSFTATRSG